MPKFGRKIRPNVGLATCEVWLNFGKNSASFESLHLQRFALTTDVILN